MYDLIKRDEEVMSALYGVFAEEAGKTTPPDFKAAMNAVVEAIAKHVASEYPKQLREVATLAYLIKFRAYADSIHRKAQENIARKEQQAKVRAKKGGKRV